MDEFMDSSFKKTVVLFSILFGVFVFGTLFGVFLVDVGYVPITSHAQPDSERAAQSKKDIAVDLIIDYGNGDTQSFPAEIAWEGSTVFDLLQKMEKRHGVSIETRNFPGVGVFIEAIHGVHNTNQSYWQFWVNGEYAKVGAGQYALKDGDKVLWKRTSERPE